MFIVNVEGAIRKDNKWIIIERGKKEEHAGGLMSLVGECSDAPHYLKQYIQLAARALRFGPTI